MSSQLLNASYVDVTSVKLQAYWQHSGTCSGDSCADPADGKVVSIGVQSFNAPAGYSALGDAYFWVVGAIDINLRLVMLMRIYAVPLAKSVGSWAGGYDEALIMNGQDPTKTVGCDGLGLACTSTDEINSIGDSTLLDAFDTCDSYERSSCTRGVDYGGTDSNGIGAAEINYGFDTTFC